MYYLSVLTIGCKVTEINLAEVHDCQVLSVNISPL